MGTRHIVAQDWFDVAQGLKVSLALHPASSPA